MTVWKWLGVVLLFGPFAIVACWALVAAWLSASPIHRAFMVGLPLWFILCGVLLSG